MCVTFSYFYPFPASRKLSATGGICLNLSGESLVLTLIYEAILVEEKQSGLAEIDLPVDMIYIPVKSFSICIVLISIAIVKYINGPFYSVILLSVFQEFGGAFAETCLKLKVIFVNLI